MSTADAPQRRRGDSALARGGVVFAGTMLVLAGIFQAFQGIAAIINDEFFVAFENYAFDLDFTVWGWIHLAIGVGLVLIGIYLFSGSVVASGFAIGIAGLSAVANFFFIPYYPVWSLLIIALDVFVIWAIVRAGSEV